MTPAGIVPRMRRFTVAGLFHSGMYEYDRGLALMHARTRRVIYRTAAMASPACGWRWPTRSRRRAWCASWRWSSAAAIYVSDWTRNHANFFRSIQMTKSMLFVILSLIVAVAAFNIVATLVMVVKEKRADIAILRTLGAGPRNILRVFTCRAC